MVWFPCFNIANFVGTGVDSNKILLKSKKEVYLERHIKVTIICLVKTTRTIIVRNNEAYLNI